MCRLVETIRIINLEPQNLDYHNRRFNMSRKMLWGLPEDNIKYYIDTMDLDPDIEYKCNIIYDEEIDAVTFRPYNKKTVKSLKIVHDNAIDYRYKYADRSPILEILNRKEYADDVLIIKNDFVTDVTFANIAFFDGDKWFTPDTPLLEGTKRARLIDEKIITPVAISVEDIHKYEVVSLINAFYDLSDLVVSTENIS